MITAAISHFTVMLCSVCAWSIPGFHRRQLLARSHKSRYCRKELAFSLVINWQWCVACPCGCSRVLVCQRTDGAAPMRSETQNPSRWDFPDEEMLLFFLRRESSLHAKMGEKRSNYLWCWPAAGTHLLQSMTGLRRSSDVCPSSHREGCEENYNLRD